MAARFFFVLVLLTMPVKDIGPVKAEIKTARLLELEALVMFTPGLACASISRSPVQVPTARAHRGNKLARLDPVAGIPDGKSCPPCCDTTMGFIQWRTD